MTETPRTQGARAPEPGGDTAPVAARPLTPAETRLWELEAGGDASGVHHFALAYRIRGPLDAARLEAAMQAVAARHVGLRVRVVPRDGRPSLEDQPELVIRLERVPDVRGVSDATSADPDAAIAALAREPFDLAIGPAWRGALFRHGDGDHTLLLRFHHIAADRWSVAVFIGDLGKGYQALAEGGTPFAGEPAGDPVAQLAGAAAAAPAEAELAAQLDYWRKLLSPAPRTLRLPDSIPDEARFDYRGARLDLEVDEAARAAAKAAGAQHAITLFPIFLTAFAAALHGRSGQTDLLLCTPVLGRHRAATRGVIGYFNNIVPLRLDLAGDPSLAELLGRARNAARDALTHAEVPLQAIAGLPELAGVRLTRALFAVQNIPGLALRLPGLDTGYRDVPNGTANFDLSLFFEEKDGGLNLMLDYKTAVLGPDAVERLKDDTLATIRRLAEHPETRLSELGAPEGEATPSPAEPRPAASQGPTDPESILEVRLLELWRRVFPESPVDPDSDFFQLGGDSMDAARLFTAIRKEFGFDLPLATLFEAPTVRLLVDRLGREDWVAPWRSVVPVQPQGTRTPLFCIHGGGGNVLAFRQLADTLGPDQPVYCLQARGLRIGDRPLTSVEEMADHYLESLRRVQPSGPYLLGGHSLGAVVAYEMAQRLVAGGESVPFVALLDHPGPGVHLSHLDWFRYHIINLSMLSRTDRLEYLRNHVRWKVRAWLAKWHLRGVAAAPGAAAENGNGAAAGESAPHAALGPISLLEASLLAIKNYRIRPYPGRLTLFRARQGSPKILTDRYGGWNDVAPGRVEVIDIPGTHMTMMRDPDVRVLGEKLSECLRALNL